MLVLVEKGKIIENILVINNDNVNNMGNYINNRSVNMKYRFFDIRIYRLSLIVNVKKEGTYLIANWN